VTCWELLLARPAHYVPAHSLASLAPPPPPRYYEENKVDKMGRPDELLTSSALRVMGYDGSISADEWAISRIYCVMTFEKVKESAFEKDQRDAPAGGGKKKEAAAPSAAVGGGDMKLAMALLKAKRSMGDKWSTLSQAEQTAAAKQHLRNT
jgi:hypothetical protein